MQMRMIHNYIYRLIRIDLIQIKLRWEKVKWRCRTQSSSTFDGETLPTGRKPVNKCLQKKSAYVSRMGTTSTGSFDLRMIPTE